MRWPGGGDREFGMTWRVMLELVGADGAVGVHEIGGGAAVAEYAPRTIGLTLAEGKRMLSAAQCHLVQAQAADHCHRRRRCQRCGRRRLLKDVRSRRLVSLFGQVEVRAPRFTPCRCAVTCRRTLNPVAEIMPDRCTPEYERVVAKMGSLLPYRRARTLMAEFLPLGKPQAVETTRQRTLRVGTRLEQEAVAGAGSKSAVVAKSMHSPSTAATFGRPVSIRGARSRFWSLRSATMRGSGSCSPACRQRPMRRHDSCAVCFMGWARRRRHRSPS
jgi:hypothetical protein